MNNQHDATINPRRSRRHFGRPLLLLSVIVVLLTGATAVFWWPKSRPKQDEIRVAAILNLSGPASRFDAVKQQALQIAESRTLELYPQSNVVLRVFDAGGGPEATSGSVREAQAWEAAVYLTGTSPTALAVAAAIRPSVPRPIHFANAANPQFGPPQPNEYRFWPDWNQEAEVIRTLLAEQSLSPILVLHSADPYSQALVMALKTPPGQTKQQILLEQQFDPAGTPDFRPTLLRAKESGVKALVIFGLPPGINALANQLAEVRWESPVIGGVNLNLSIETFRKLRLTCPLWSIETDAMAEVLPPGSESAAFRDAYRAKFGDAPPFHALYLADALYLLVAAEQDSRKSGSAVSAVIANGLTFPCSSGVLSLSANGILTIPMHVKRLQ